MNSKLTANDLIHFLKLSPHQEGGYFSEVYRSPISIEIDGRGSRSLCTTIYYLLTSDRPTGHLHQNRSDIVHYFHLGDPAVYTTLDLGGHVESFTMGADLKAGHCAQRLVPGGFWKGSILVKSGSYALISESVSPGFDYADMQFATHELIRKQFPESLERVSHLIQGKS